MMLFSKTRSVVVALVALIVVTTGAWLIRQTAAQTTPNPTPTTLAAPKTSPAGLRLTLVAVPAADSDDHAFHLDVVLHNASSKDLNLYMGWAAANNGALFPLALTIKAVDKDGKTRVIPVGPDPVQISGRLDPFVVSLPAAGTYTLRTREALGGPKPADAGRFYLPPGAYTFTASYTAGPIHEKPLPGDVYEYELSRDLAGLALMTYWSGAVTSASVTVSVPASEK